MTRRHPRSTSTAPLFPYTTPCRSLPAAEQRLLPGGPAQAGDDGLDAAPLAGAVVPGADVGAGGQAVGLVDGAVVGAVEEVLQRAAHVAEVLGGAENDPVGGQHVVRPGLEGGEGAGLDTRDLRRARALDHRVAQPGRVLRRHVSDDEEALHGVYPGACTGRAGCAVRRGRSEEHTSGLQSLMRITYAGLCLNKK